MAVAGRARMLTSVMRPAPTAVGPWDGLLYLMLIMGAVLASVAGAGWLEGRPGVALAPLAGLVIGLGLARWRALPPLVAHWLALLAGGALALWLAGSAVAPPAAALTTRLELLAFRLYQWLDLAQRGQWQPDQALATVALALSLALLAHAAAWCCYRRGWFWASVIPAGAAVAVLGLGRPPALLPLTLYVVGVVALLARGHVERREVAWRELGVAPPRRFRRRLAGMGATLATLLVAGSLLLPVIGRDARLVAAWNTLDTPLQRFGTTLDQVWQQLQGGTAAGGSYASFGSSFEIGGYPALSDAPVARLSDPEPRYLRAVTYDRYTGRGWQTTTPESFTAVDGSGTLFSSQVQLGPSVRLPVQPAGAPVTTTEIELLRPKGSLLLTPGRFASGSMPVNVRVGWVRFDRTQVDLSSPAASQLPPVVQPLVGRLRQASNLPPAQAVLESDGSVRQVIEGAARGPQGEREVAIIRNEIERLRRQRGIVAAFTTDERGRVAQLVLNGYAPRYDDIEAVFANDPVTPNTTYRVQTVAAEPTADELRAVSSPAPEWVRARYLTLPAALPGRVRDLAATITASETTAYDKARALERSLRTLTYDLATPAPPPGRDVVDYFLFDDKRGYCEQFASAMVVMARALDIPARMVTGYNPGEEVEGGRLVRERNAHAWPELYFAGYGWVTFEPTPSVAVPARGEPSPAEAPPVLLAVPTPAPTPTGQGDGTSVDTWPSLGVPSDGTDGPAWLGGLARAVQLTLLLVLAVAATISAIWWHGVRGLSGAGRWYGRVVRLGRWIGLRPGPTTTPFELAEEVSRLAPAAAASAEMIAQLYAQERYGGRPATPAQEARARRAWRQVRGALLWRRARRERDA